LSPKKESEVIAEMTANVTDDKLKAELTARASLLISAINHAQFEKIAKAKTKAVKLTGAVVSALFYGNNVSFTFKRQKGIGESASGNEKKIKIKKTTVSTKEITKATKATKSPSPAKPHKTKTSKRKVIAAEQIKVAKVTKKTKPSKHKALPAQKKLTQKSAKGLLTGVLTATKKKDEKETVEGILNK
jgi:hypothetical protein